MAEDITLFGRAWRITVDTIEITDLDCTFQVEKSLASGKPNTAEVKIWNLTEDQISHLENVKTPAVKIEAGYGDTLSTIFLGRLRTANTEDDGPADTVTTISSGDGEVQIQTARINKPIGKNTKAEDVIRELVKALGVGEGNLSQAVKDIQLTIGGQLFPEGGILSGSAAREMTGICRSVGLGWSIQDGKLLLLPLGKVLEGEALLVSPETGMIGSPTVDNNGIMTVKMLLIPDVFPGRKLVLESKRLKGQYRIETARYSGDTSGVGDWYVEVEGKRY
jgi:hypothetical protein